MAKYMSKLNGYEIKDANARAKNAEQDQLINEIGGRVSVLEATTGGGSGSTPSVTSEATKDSTALITSGGVYNAIQAVKTPLETEVTELKQTTATNTNDIKNLKTGVSSNTTNITALNNRVSEVEGDLADLENSMGQGDTTTLNNAKAYTNTEVNKAKEELNTAIAGKSNSDHNHDNAYAPKATTYSKAETQELIESAKTELNNSITAVNSIKEITLPQTNWGTLASGGYYITISDTAFTSAMYPVCDVKQTGMTNEERITAREEWGKVYYVQTGSGSITFQATEKPSIDLVVLVKGA